MKNKIVNLKGFSLVELMVVVAVLGIIAAISFESFGNTKKATQADSACNDVAAAINKTRNYALTGKTIGGSVPDSFVVSSSSSADKTTVTISGTSESLDLPVKVDSDFSIGFDVPYGNASGAGTTVTFNGAGGSKRVLFDGYKARCE